MARSGGGGAGGEFNPQSLFTGGAPGYLYDTNDLSTLFLDTAGSTLASVNGLVGLQFDKHLALATGSDLKGTGAVGLAGVAAVATYNTITGVGTATRVDAANQSYVQFSGLSDTAGFYKMVIVNTGVSTTSVRSGTFSGTSWASVGASTSATIYVPAAGGIITITSSAGIASFTVSSMQLVSGSHRYQSTTASKPILRGTPTGANLVTNGDFASGLTGWTNPDTAPGTTTAAGGGALMNNNTTGTARLRQSLTVPAGSYRLTFTVTGFSGAISATTVAIGNATGGDSTYGTITVTGNGTYTRYIDSVTGPTLGLAFIVVTGVGACSFTLDNVDVRNISSASVTAPYALQFDGVDDFLQTASVDFTSTDAVTVCNGLRKLSDAATGMAIELTISTAATNGSFHITAPSGTGTLAYDFSSRGTTRQTAVSGASYTAPITSVITGIGDISLDVCTLRINGTQAATTALDQGTGNYSNAIIYFGRRAGTSLPFLGLIFSGWCVGKTVNASELTSGEAWVTTRTGVLG